MANEFWWNELLTGDMSASKEFYARLFGWTVEEAPAGEPLGTYYLFKNAREEVAGLMQLPSGIEDVPPHWLSYVKVDDADAATQQAQALGATVRVPPTDVPGTGRFAVLIDPVGAAIGVIQPE